MNKKSGLYSGVLKDPTLKMNGKMKNHIYLFQSVCEKILHLNQGLVINTKVERTFYLSLSLTHTHTHTHTNTRCDCNTEHFWV